MKYELDRLGPDNFEKLIQSLLMGIAGAQTIVYGDGPDGGRDAVIQNANHEIVKDVRAKGYTVAQMKFKSPDGKEDDWTWLQKNLKKELDSFQERKETRPELVPETYLFFTNIILTPTLDSGTRDKAEKYVRQYSDIIPHIFILGLDEIRAMLDNNPNVARSYAAFITPGDVLKETRDYMDDLRSKPFSHLIEYLYQSFKENHAVRLEEAGKRSDDRIMIRNVYTDLEARTSDGREENIDRMAASILSWGERAHPRGLQTAHGVDSKATHSNLVIIGNAGQGKSTLCQYICQIYRAALIKEYRPEVVAADLYFSGEGEGSITPPQRKRFPVTINLKNYAGWLNKREVEKDRSVAFYILSLIKGKSDGQFDMEDMRKLLKQHAWVFVFDGLDEVPASSNRREVLERIQEFIGNDLSDTHCDSMVVCTSRPQGYDNAFSPVYYRHYELKNMSPKRCGEYMDRLLAHLEENSEKREHYRGILKRALETPLTSDLMTTPLYTAIIVILVKSGGTPPTRRYDLFHDYCEIIRKREQEKGMLPEVSEAYDWVDPLHAEIGLLLQAESETKENTAAELSETRCREIINQYIEKEGNSGKEADELSNAIYGAITSRLPFLSEVGGNVLFPLRSIQEYFAAEWIIKSNDSQHDAVRRILQMISVSAYWRNVFLFVAGYYAKHDNLITKNEAIYNICRCNNGEEEFNCPDPVLYHAALSGSFLALDMVKDNLFKKPTDRKKYLALAAKPLSSFNTDLDLKLNSQLPEKYEQSFLMEYVLPEVQNTMSGDSAAFKCLYSMAVGGMSEAKIQLEQIIERVEPSKEAYYVYLSNDKTDSFESKTLFVLLCWVICPNYIYPNIVEDIINRTRNTVAIQNNYYMYRRLFYALLSFGSTGWLKHSFISEYDDPLSTLCYLCIKVRHIFIQNRKNDWGHGLSFQAFTYTYTDQEETDLHSELFTFYGLHELTALVDFLVTPTQQTLTRLLSTYGDIPEGDKEFFRSVITPYSWLLAEISHQLENERVEDVLAFYDETGFDACIKKEEKIKELIDAKNLHEITVQKLWKVVQADFEDAELRHALFSSEEARMDDDLWRHFTVTADSLTNGEFDNEIPYCLQLLPKLFQTEAGTAAAIYTLAKASLQELAKPSTIFPSAIDAEYYYDYYLIKFYHIDGLLPQLYKKLEAFVQWGGTFLEAYAIIPYIMQFGIIPLLSTENIFSHLISVHSKGNRLAVLGCLLIVLTGPLSEEIEVTATEDIRDLIQEKKLEELWDRCAQYFSFDGIMQVYKVLTDFTEAQQVPLKRLISRYRAEIRRRLEAQPVNTEELIKEMKKAHSN